VQAEMLEKTKPDLHHAAGFSQMKVGLLKQADDIFNINPRTTCTQLWVPKGFHLLTKVSQLQFLWDFQDEGC